MITQKAHGVIKILSEEDYLSFWRIVDSPMYISLEKSPRGFISLPRLFLDFSKISIFIANEAIEVNKERTSLLFVHEDLNNLFSVCTELSHLRKSANFEIYTFPGALSTDKLQSMLRS